MSHTPEHAIREWLASVPARPPRIRPFWRRRSKVVARVGGPLSFRMRPDTARFVKRKEASGRELWYVICEAEAGWRGTVQARWTVVVTQEAPDQWKAVGAAGGGGDSPVRGYPWANLGGSWGDDGFCAGGTVEDAGKGVTLVRLSDGQGRTFEDTIGEGIVLFISDERVAMPMRVDLYDANGQVVGSHEWGF